MPAANPLPAVPTGNNVRTLLEPHLQTGIFDPRDLGETTVSPDFGPDRVHQWSLGVQQEISQNAALEVRYVGNHGTRLFQTIDGNPYILGLANTVSRLVPAGLKPCPASQAAIPELIGRVNCTGGALVRNAGTLATRTITDCRSNCARSSLWNQLTLQSLYTFSKTTDNTSEIGATLAAAGNTFGAFAESGELHGSGTRSLGAGFPAQTGYFPRWKNSPFLRHRGGFAGSRPGRLARGCRFTLLSSGQPYTAVQFGTQLCQRWRRVRRIRRATPTLTIPHLTRRSPCRMVRFDRSWSSNNAPVQVGRHFRRTTSAPVMLPEISAEIPPSPRPH